MQKKMKLQQVLILVLAVIISLLFITVLAGRNDRVSVVVVAGDKIDTNVKLNEQQNLFTVKQILEEDLEAFGGSLVTNISELNEQYLRFELPKGSPIPKDYLSKEKQSGEFASELTKYHTVFNFIDGKAALPPDVQPGDKLDVMLTLQPLSEDEGLITGPLLTNISVVTVGETDVAVMVTQNDFNKLALAQEIGTFVLQLPGQKTDSKSCEDLDKDDEAATCYTEQDRPTTISEFDLRDYVKTNGALSENGASIGDELESLFEMEEEVADEDTDESSKEKQK